MEALGRDRVATAVISGFTRGPSLLIWHSAGADKVWLQGRIGRR